MTPLAIFGITNDALNLAVNLLLLFLVVFWIALIYWTFTDARRRISDPMLVGCATAASLFPFVGTVVYMIVRPPEFLEDVRERELEIAAAEARLASMEHQACPHCFNEVEKSYLRCPSCHQRLKEPCKTCGKPLDPRWSICPFCEAEVGQSAQPSRQRRERRRERAPSGTTQMPAREAPPRAPRTDEGEAVAAPAARAARSPRQPRPAPEGEPRTERTERPTAADGAESAPRRARPQL